MFYCFFVTWIKYLKHSLNLPFFFWRIVVSFVISRMNQIRRIVPYSPNKGMQYIFIQAFIITNLTMGMHQPIIPNPRARLLFYSFLLKNKHNFLKNVSITVKPFREKQAWVIDHFKVPSISVTNRNLWWRYLTVEIGTPKYSRPSRQSS
jgi:hypothetical protein